MWLGLCGLVCTLAGLPAWAADAPATAPATPPATLPAGVDAGALLQQQRQQLKPSEVPVAPGSGPRIQLPATTESAKPADGVRVTVKSFVLQGQDLVFPDQQLLDLLASAQGQTLGLAELRAVVDRITQLYRQHGYFLARAVLPAQDVSEGVVAVRVLQGRLQDSDAAEDSAATGPEPAGSAAAAAAPTAPPQVNAPAGVQLAATAAPGQGPQRLDLAWARRLVAAALRPGQPLKLAEVERGVLLLNDVPGVSAGANLEPGRQADTTRLVLDLNQGPLWQGSLGADNHGSRYTNSQRLSAQLQANNPSGQGDQAQLALSASPDGDYRYGRLGYATAVGLQGLRLGAAVSGLGYKLGQELTALESEGSASTVGLSARYPLLRSRASNLNLTAAADVKRLRNKALALETSNKKVQMLSAGLSADHLSSTGAGSWAEINLSLGHLDLAANPVSLQQDQGAQGAHTQGRFAKLNLSLGHSRRLGPRLSLLAQAQGQLASTNLDSSEKFLLGGAGGVRAYPSGEAAGDSGVRLSLEARWMAASFAKAGDLTLAAFVDWGQVQQLQNKPAGLVQTTPNHYQLASAGLGATLALPGQHELRLQWAHKLGHNPGRSPVTGLDADGRSGASRAWLSLQMSF